MSGWKESKPDRHGAVYCPSLQRRPEIFGLKMFFFSLSPARYNSDDDSSSVASATHIG